MKYFVSTISFFPNKNKDKTDMYIPLNANYLRLIR